MRTEIYNRIVIREPTKEVITWAKERLTFSNPEYEKKQRMGKWLGRTPKELRLYEWMGNALVVPFGVCRELMPMALKGTVVSCFRQDEIIPFGEAVPLYDYQKEAVQEMMKKKFGILVSPAGSGKTQMGIALIKGLRRRALWLCHTKDLLNQSRDRAARYMDAAELGTITEGKVNIGNSVTFATVQTMANLDLPLYRDVWDVVIVDECHRVGSSASSFTRYERVLNNLGARHKYGLTATPERSDGLIQATFAMLGGVAWQVPESAVADRIMKVTVERVETETEVTEECLDTDGTIIYTELLRHLTTDEKRNRRIAEKIAENRGHSCIILSDRLEQLKELMGMLPGDMQAEAGYIDGKMSGKTAKARREEILEKMRTGELKYLFASYSLCREGLDIPRLDRLFMASPVKFSSVVVQSVGRIARTFEGKGTPVCYDFVDGKIGFCERAYRERKRSYRRIGANIVEGEGFIHGGL